MLVGHVFEAALLVAVATATKVGLLDGVLGGVYGHAGQAPSLLQTSQFRAGEATESGGRASSKAAAKVGDGPGRPLYALGAVTMPSKTGQRCITLRHDTSSHALTVDKSDADANSIAWGCYDDKIETTGWSNLQVTTSSLTAIPLALRAYGAGFVEGLLTQKRIGEFFQNVNSLHKKDVPRGLGGNVIQAAMGGDDVDNALRMSLIAWDTLAGGDAASEPDDAISRQAWCAMLQLRGVRDGHNLLACQGGVCNGQTLSAFQIMFLNMHSELPAIVELYRNAKEAAFLETLAVKTAAAAAAAEQVAAEKAATAGAAVADAVTADADATAAAAELLAAETKATADAAIADATKANVMAGDAATALAVTAAAAQPDAAGLSFMQTGRVSNQIVDGNLQAKRHWPASFQKWGRNINLLNLEAVARVRDPEAIMPGDRARQRWVRWAAHMPHGSAVVRRIGSEQSPQDLITGHVTFGEYGEMLRVMKHYTLYFDTLVDKISMSSYPGCISSTDDYMMTDKGYVLMSTNLGVPDDKLGHPEYSRPADKPDGLPSFLRSIVATRLAMMPRSWAKVYGFLPGIAGAKQWLLVNYGLLRDFQPIADETVWLIESLPRRQRAEDVSIALRNVSYFQAHGEPHFAEFRNVFGLPPKVTLAEEHKKSALLDKAMTIQSLDSGRSMLQEFIASRGESQIPITTRDDLDLNAPIPAGGIDMKVTSKCLVSQMGAQVKGSPAFDATNGAFRWTKDGSAVIEGGWPHIGVPNTLDFDWATALPESLTYHVNPKLAACEVNTGGR